MTDLEIRSAAPFAVPAFFGNHAQDAVAVGGNQADQFGAHWCGHQISTSLS
jgi:hypothetical protein